MACHLSRDITSATFSTRISRLQYMRHCGSLYMDIYLVAPRNCSSSAPVRHNTLLAFFCTAWRLDWSVISARILSSKNTGSTQWELSAHLEGLEDRLPIEGGMSADGSLASRGSFLHLTLTAIPFHLRHLHA